MSEELVSESEYRRRYKIGYEALKRMIYNKEVETRGKKIVIRNNDIVSRELYENEIKKRVEAETKLANIQKIIDMEVS